MKASELKLKILEEIDRLESGPLEELYGQIRNFVQRNNSIEEWNSLTPVQRKGIEEGIQDFDQGKGIVHEHVIEAYRKKFSGA